MKTKTTVLVTITALTLMCSNAFAQDNKDQTENQYTRKKHFVFGTNLINYDATKYYNTTSGIPFAGIGGNATTHTLTVTLNWWVGYFVTNKVCVGLAFGNQQSTFSEIGYLGYLGSSVALSSPYVPSSLFFRFYLVKDSGNVADLFLEGNAGGGYSTTGINSSYGSTQIWDINANISLVLSRNLTPHFALQIRAGAAFGYASITGPNNNYSGPPVITYYTENVVAPSFIASLGFQYKL